jgi:hypothetical protein
MFYSKKKAYNINVLMTIFMLRDFCFSLLLFLVIIIKNLLLTNDTTMPENVSAIYSTSTIVYAQQQHQQSTLAATRNQEWIDEQSNTKVSFTYLPERPMVGGSTELKFNVEGLKTSTPSKDVFARVTIIDGQQQQVPLRSYNITAPDGFFSIKYQFAHEGTYQIIVKLNSKYSALTLASFTILVPFQPFGVFNVNYISPLLLPAALVGIVGVVIILAFMIAVNKKRKKSAP